MHLLRYHSNDCLMFSVVRTVVKKNIYIYIPEKVDDIEFFAHETYEGNI